MSWRDHMRVPCAFCGVDLLRPGVVEEQVKEIYLAELLELDAGRGLIYLEEPPPEVIRKIWKIADQLTLYALPVLGVNSCAKCAWERSAGGIIPAGAMPIPQQRVGNDKEVGLSPKP